MIGIVRAPGNGDANASRDDGEVVVVVVVATKMMKRLYTESRAMRLAGDVAVVHGGV